MLISVIKISANKMNLNLEKVTFSPPPHLKKIN